MKFMFLAFDGMGYNSLVEPYIDEEMPFYRKIRNGEGVYGSYQSVYRMTLPSWMSIYTGVKKEKHLVDQSITSLLTRPLVETYWEFLGNSGLSQGCFHMPLTYPPSKLNGWMVSGFPGPTEELLDCVWCFPAKLQSLLSGYSRSIDDFELPNDESMLKVIKEKWILNFDVLQKFYGELNVDCLSVGFQFPDFVGHFLTESVAAELCSVINFLTEKLIQMFSPERFLICADHGWKTNDGHEHAIDGSLFIGGNGIKNRLVPGHIHEWDIYPLIIKLCGLKPPLNIDGRDFSIFQNETSEKERNQMEDKLRRLGYFD